MILKASALSQYAVIIHAVNIPLSNPIAAIVINQSM